MSVITDKLSQWFSTTEADVLQVIVKVKNGIQYAEAELAAAFTWLENHAGDVAASVETVAKVVGALSAAGVGIPPSVQQAVKDANAAVTGLNAMVSSQEKGTPQALIDGYVAAKQAWSAADAASVAVASAPTTVA